MPSSSMNLKDCDPKVIFAHIQAEKPRKVPQKLGFSSKSNPPLDPTKQISKFSGNKIKQRMLAGGFNPFFQNMLVKLDQLNR